MKTGSSSILNPEPFETLDKWEKDLKGDKKIPKK